MEQRRDRTETQDTDLTGTFSPLWMAASANSPAIGAKMVSSYLLVGSLWVLGSSWLLPNQTVVWSYAPILNQGIYVLVTAGILFWFIQFELRAIHQRYLSLTNVAPVGFFYTNREGNGLYVNDRYCEITGLSFDEALGAGWRARLHPEDRDWIAREWNRSVQEKQPFRQEYRVQRSDGMITWVLGQAVAEHNAAGQLTGYIGTITDISDRKQAEVKLQQSQQQYQDLINSLNGIFWEVDLQTFQFTFVSPQAEPMLGYPIDQWLLPDFWRDHLYPDDQTWAVDYCLAASRSKQDHEFEYRMIAADGRIVWLQDIVKVVIEADQPVKLRGVMIDISQRKQIEAEHQVLERELAKKQQLLDAFITSAPVGICILNQQLQFTYINETLAEINGLSVEAHFGKTPWEIVPDLAPQQEEVFRHVLTTGEPVLYFEVSGETLKLPGVTRTWLVSYFPICSDPEQLIGIGIVVNEITDRKQAEAALRQSEANWRLMMQYMPAMVDAFDDNLNLVIWNQECERVTGYSAEEMIGNPEAIHLLYPDPVYLNQMLSEWQQRPDDYRGWEWNITCKDGSVKTISWSNISSLFPIPGLRTWGIGIDITDRKRAEAELRASEEKFRSLGECSPIGIYLATPDGSITYTNPRCQKIYAATAEELLGNGWAKFIHSQVRERVLQLWQDSAARGQIFSAEYQLHRQEDDPRWVQEKSAPIFSEQGELLGHVGTVEDVTAYKQAGAAIRQLNETLEHQNQHLEQLVAQRTSELESLINTMPDYIFVIERDTMRITFCNDAFAQGIDFVDRQQIQGKTIFECFSPEQSCYFQEQNRAVFESGTTLHLNETITLPDGDHHFETFKIPLKRQDGEIYALLGISRDYTQLIETQYALSARTAQLEASNQELDSFSYSVSHDLRAPLRHIHGFVVALTHQLEQKGVLEEPKIAHYLQVIQTSSQKMGQLIDGLLTLSRVGRKPLTDTRINLNNLVDAAVAQIPEFGSEVDLATGNRPPAIVELTIGPLPNVMGDPTLLQQVFANLLDNAVKFSRGRCPARVEVGALANGTIFVRDNGVGFQMKYANQVFGAFQRLHSQAEFEGTGIGLAIVQRIIQRHGGTIWAESEPDRGTIFYFKLVTLAGE